VPINNEARVLVGSDTSVVTSLISRITSPTRFFEGARRGKTCVR
jgi:hypothetical protein